MIKFHLKPLKEKIGVYLLYVKNELAYVGRSSNLRSRLNDHFNPNDPEYQEWKSLIDVIEYYPCESLADSDIIETYLINTLHPTFNKEKVYLGGVTIKVELPEKYEVEEIEDDGFPTNGSFKEYCQKYISSPDERFYIGDRFPIIREAFTKLGAKRMKALGYLVNRLIDELKFNNIDIQQCIKDELIRLLDIETFYSLAFVKNTLNNIYEKLDIAKKGKAIDIANYAEVKYKTVRLKGKFVKGVEVLNYYLISFYCFIVYFSIT